MQKLRSIKIKYFLKKLINKEKVFPNNKIRERRKFQKTKIII